MFGNYSTVQYIEFFKVLQTISIPSCKSVSNNCLSVLSEVVYNFYIIEKQFFVLFLVFKSMVHIKLLDSYELEISIHVVQLLTRLQPESTFTHRNLQLSFKTWSKSLSQTLRKGKEAAAIWLTTTHCYMMHYLQQNR